MIIKYDKNKKKLKKPINFDLQDALKIDAEVFLNNIKIISDKKLKDKQNNYNKKKTITININLEKLWLEDKLKYTPKWYKPEVPDFILENLKKLYKEIDRWGQI